MPRSSRMGSDVLFDKPGLKITTTEIILPGATIPLNKVTKVLVLGGGQIGCQAALLSLVIGMLGLGLSGVGLWIIGLPAVGVAIWMFVQGLTRGFSSSINLEIHLGSDDSYILYEGPLNDTARQIVDTIKNNADVVVEGLPDR